MAVSSSPWKMCFSSRSCMRGQRSVWGEQRVPLLAQVCGGSLVMDWCGVLLLTHQEQSTATVVAHASLAIYSHCCCLHTRAIYSHCCCLTLEQSTATVVAHTL